MTSRERGWGSWTVTKLDALSKYLVGFTRACSVKSPNTLYLDLFAGGYESFERESGRPIEGSPQRALGVQPPFTKLAFFELDQERCATLRAEVATAFPGRDVDVVAGDCNVSVPRYLNDLVARDPDWRWRPSFAFIDQFSAEIHWDTIKALAELRPGKWKTELWLYFGETFLVRGLGTRGDGGEHYATRIDAMYGNRAWRDIHDGWRDRLLTGEQRKAELVNLMRWQLERDLGYTYTLPLQIVKDDGQPIYTMIFATDNEAGDRIMQSVLTGAAAEMDERYRSYQLRRAMSKREAVGQFGFGAIDEQLSSANVRASNRELLTLAAPAEPWTYPTQR